MKTKLNEVEAKDQNLLCRLEEAKAFGKVLFMMKPVHKIPMKDIRDVVLKRFCSEFEVAEEEILAKLAKRK